MRTRKRAVLNASIAFLGFVAFASTSFAATDTSSADAVSFKQTVKVCDAAGHKEVAEQVAGMLDYKGQLMFRKLCGTRGMDDGTLSQAGEELRARRYSFEQARSFEALTGMRNFNASHVMPALNAISSLSFASGQTFRNFASLQGATADHALQIIPQLNEASPLVNKAARSYFGVRGMSVDAAIQGIPTLTQMRKRQAEAVMAFAELPGMNPNTMNQGMGMIRRMDDVNAWTARCLFKNKEVSGQEGIFWLQNFFSLTPSQQEGVYDRLNARQKSVLLKGLYDGAEEAIWKINNLHAITNDNGYEYGAATLARMGSRDLTYLFNRLDATTRARFAGAFGGGSVGVLQQATSAARVQAAKDLPTAQMYVVLAQGSELYDSSFRDILVPVMKSRIASRNNGDLLGFLRQIDPESRFVSDFISACAQKGKLTEFFPQDFARQREILNLVSNSAFKDPDSVLLFSATFSYLLKMLTPEARTHLINLMSERTQSGDPMTAKLVRVVLQYYAQSYPDLLGQNDRLQISRLLVQQGSVNLDRYLATPFAEWKADGKLSSLSMYHPDDDGRQSFASNASLLMKNGYQLMPSREYSIGGTCGTGGGVGGIFSVMRSQRCAISFVKTVGGTRITHTQFVYSDKETQKELLRRFILSGDEMLAQRGHSYWRSEQIIEPLQELIEEGKITPADLRKKQRFLSLGSCGGVKVYTTLTRLFEGRVDLLASIGTGLAMINDPYNKSFCEIVANNPSGINWRQVSQQTVGIFSSGKGQDYLQPGSLTAILHKILDEAGVRGNIGSQASAAQQRGQQTRQEQWLERQQQRQAEQTIQQQQRWTRPDGGPVYVPRAERARMEQEMRQQQQERQQMQQQGEPGRPVYYGN